MDPATQAIIRLFNPRTQQWREHFRQVGFTIEGLTDIGRATVRLLNMNAMRRVELRAELGIELDPQ